MNVAYDLHIHSSLSPCADNDMTPNNIVNMSILKGLDVIAITDHNSCANVQAIVNCAKNTSLLVIPGIEIETAEEIHVICLFSDMERAAEMQKLVYSRLPDIKNKEEIFGEQLIFDEKDNLISKESRLLLTAADITINEVFDIVNNELNGIAIPAHIDRQANSIISSFGTIPEDIDVKCVEISDRNTESTIISNLIKLNRTKRIYSSDAHYLWDIHEREYFVEVESLTITNVIKTLGVSK
ncbi:PHP domain-containing protein [Ruminiclostridium herbifermentans]|uniref:PHP domain-containing protein n=1 Tax=Ruminiclostridium herbifermentans TaxID=2488810 RepID=A0A4U7JLN7_9FIRM|nr:PHP domain-containing protein [Ruminiclostridium herbifermentans]QNU68218.1 PHP domain-containing protein [Ruminiclostridium herbifermentans]